MKTRVLAAMMVTTMLGALPPQTADACMRKRMFHRPRKSQVDPKLRDLRASEHLLAQGKYKRAVKKARRAFRDVTRAGGAGVGQEALFDRAQRVVAVAAVRSAGAIDVDRTMKGKEAYDREVNLAWANAVLQYQAARYADNMVVTAQYAEALSHVNGLQDYAYDVLRDLADEDLMPTARGFALLASLQQERGDTVGRDASLARCREVGGTANCTIA